MEVWNCCLFNKWDEKLKKVFLKILRWQVANEQHFRCVGENLFFLYF